jgi:hypothetical protein
VVNYRKYINSRRWKKRRLRYYRKFGKACAACRTADAPITLHHMSYDRLGAELDDDLLALCRPCHDRLHRLYPQTCRETTLLYLADYQRPAEPFLSLSATETQLST